MKNFLKRLSSLTLAVLLMAALAVPAAAASTVTFTDKYTATVEDGTAYHKTDLFGTFKNVMPGDTLTDTVTITNKIPGSSYINVYLEVVPHSSEAQADYSRAQAALDGKTAENMDAFLSLMTMEVKQGSKVIYSGKANQAQKSVSLGKINKGRSMDLTVTLNVSLEMGNAFMDHLGEIDWVIKYEVVEGDNLIQTGQLNWPIPVLGTLGLGLIFLGIWTNRKKKKNA